MSNKPTSPRLIDIIEAVKAVEAELIGNGGELTEDIEARIADNDAALEDKLDAYAGAIQYVKSQEDMLKAEAKRLSDRARSYANSREQMRSRMADAMRLLGVHSVKTASHSFSFRSTESWSVDTDRIASCQRQLLLARSLASEVLKVDLASLKKAVAIGEIPLPDFVDITTKSSVTIR